MNKAIQLFFRILSPVIVGTIFLILSTSENLQEVFARVKTSDFEYGKLVLPGILLLVTGFIIHKFIRPKILNGVWSEIDYAVKQRLVKIAGLNDSEAVKLLSAKKRLIRVFFKLIDSDESLKNTSDNVRLNGLIITTLADIQLFSALAIVLIAIKEIAFNSNLGWDLVVILFCFFCLFISERLLVHFKKIHIELGAEQLAELRAHHKQATTDKINELLKDVKNEQSN